MTTTRRLNAEEFSLWVQEVTGDCPSLYVEPVTFLIEGDLDTDRLRQALVGVLASRPLLSASIQLTGTWPEMIVPKADSFRTTVPLLDCPPDPGASVDEHVRAFVRQRWHQGLDLENGILCRAWILRAAPGVHAFVLLIHHLVTDGWSNRVLAAEIAARYTGREIETPAPSVAAPAATEDVLPLPELGSAVADPFPGPGSYGVGDSFVVPCEIAGLPAAASRAGVTPFTLHVAALQQAVRDATGVSSFLMAFADAGRRGSNDASTVGYFVRTRLLAGTAAQNLDDLCDEIFDSVDGVSLTPEVIARLGAAGLPAPAVALAVDAHPELRLPGCQVTWLPVPLPRTRYPLALMLSHPPGATPKHGWLIVEHDPARVPPEAARAVADGYTARIERYRDGPA